MVFFCGFGLLCGVAVLKLCCSCVFFFVLLALVCFSVDRDRKPEGEGGRESERKRDRERERERARDTDRQTNTDRLGRQAGAETESMTRDCKPHEACQSSWIAAGMCSSRMRWEAQLTGRRKVLLPRLAMLSKLCNL